MRSSVINGEVLDWVYSSDKDRTFFRVGEHLIGTLVFSKKNGWSATPWHGLGAMVHGFKTRYWASNYLFELWRVYNGIHL